MQRWQAIPLILAGIILIGTLVAFFFWLQGRQALSSQRPSIEELYAAYAKPLPQLEGPVSVYHLGHSLTGRDMPAFLAQLGAHGHHLQLGWGASLQQHWQEKVPGLAEENATEAHRPAHAAFDSGEYPVLVLTEMVELQDAIRFHDSAKSLGLWAEKAWSANPEARIYLYETWHARKDRAIWLSRLTDDLPQLWQGELILPVFATGEGRPIHIIPGGQVMAAFARAAEMGELPGAESEALLFSDDIHFNDLGAYLMALTHYAVIYGKSPLGLPHNLIRADGTEAEAPSLALAEAMQALVWQVVTTEPSTGVVQQGA